MKGKIESVMKRRGAMDRVTHKAVVNMQAVGEAAETTRQFQKPEMRSKTRNKGPIQLPGFSFAYCLVSVSEFSGSHYCERGVQCNVT